VLTPGASATGECAIVRPVGEDVSQNWKGWPGNSKLPFWMDSKLAKHGGSGGRIL
jgi:hypothetical protein